MPPVRESIAPPIRLARTGSLPNVMNMGSMLVVLLERVKPVCVGSVAVGWRVSARRVTAAACIV